MKNKKAFSIIETIIVIAILAILSTIIIPWGRSIINPFLPQNVERASMLNNIQTAKIAAEVYDCPTNENWEGREATFEEIRKHILIGPPHQANTNPELADLHRFSPPKQLGEIDPDEDRYPKSITDLENLVHGKLNLGKYPKSVIGHEDWPTITEYQK